MLNIAMDTTTHALNKELTQIWVPCKHTHTHTQRQPAPVFIHHYYAKTHICPALSVSRLSFFHPSSFPERTLFLTPQICGHMNKIWTVCMCKAGKQKLGPTHPLQEWMAIISMRLPGSTLQCSDTHNGECHASPCCSPREALLLKQHLDLTSTHLRLMTPFFARSQLLIPSLPLSSSPPLKKPALPFQNTHPSSPSSPSLYPVRSSHIDSPPVSLPSSRWGEQPSLASWKEGLCTTGPYKKPAGWIWKPKRKKHQGYWPSVPLGWTCLLWVCWPPFSLN